MGACYYSITDYIPCAILFIPGIYFTTVNLPINPLQPFLPIPLPASNHHFVLCIYVVCFCFLFVHLLFRFHVKVKLYGMSISV